MTQGNTPNGDAASEDGGTIHDVAQEYSDLDLEIKTLKARVSELTKKKDKLAEALLDGMLLEGAASIVLEAPGGAKVNIHPRTMIWAKKELDAEPREFAEALDEAGLGFLVQQTVNSNSLSGVVRERAEANGLSDAGVTRLKGMFPERLQKVLAITTSPSLAIRRTAPKVKAAKEES